MSKQVLANRAQPCVWMCAGVLRYRLCPNDFDCDNCLLDAALRGDAGQYLGLVVHGGFHEIAGHHFVLEHPLIVVDVLEEEVQGLEMQKQTFFGGLYQMIEVRRAAQ